MSTASRLPARSLGVMGASVLAMLLGPLGPLGSASAQEPQPADGAQAAPPASPSEDPFARPTPHDPDDAPFLRAPRNQWGQPTAARRPTRERGFDDDHWVQLTLVPTYAAIHLPFIGRGEGPYRGAGIGLELDVRVVRWLFLRVYGSHTLHPVPRVEAYDPDTDELAVRARAGVLQATDTGLSIVYALDLGRFVPRVDVGAGLLFVRSPAEVQAGQWGAECRTGNVCDLGLSCSSAQICEPAPFPEVHAGIALDILLGQRWTVGVGVRYHALIQAISQFPMFVTGHVRLGIRF